MLCWVPGTTTDEEKEGMEDFVGGARTGLEKNDAPVSALLWAELSHTAAPRTGRPSGILLTEHLDSILFPVLS